ncbi:hypothetical protein PIB30_098550 [Stylosanthes scabra]|uniref:Uncharacterized protein n=1 Tax=Stylosanthes scabra TaxID=79078 RepID=A0ABU6WUS5_9FABA|nr:hypothetical protein [Stylosanthes scabra]
MQFLQQSFYENMQKLQADYVEETLVNNKRLQTEKNLQQAVERQGRDIAEMRKQLTLWTRNTSTREAYPCWAHQQANANLDYGASTSSQADLQEPVPLQTGPPIPGF